MLNFDRFLVSQYYRNVDVSHAEAHNASVMMSTAGNDFTEQDKDIIRLVNALSNRKNSSDGKPVVNKGPVNSSKKMPKSNNTNNASNQNNNNKSFTSGSLSPSELTDYSFPDGGYHGDAPKRIGSVSSDCSSVERYKTKTLKDTENENPFLSKTFTKLDESSKVLNYKQKRIKTKEAGDVKSDKGLSATSSSKWEHEAVTKSKSNRKKVFNMIEKVVSTSNILSKIDKSSTNSDNSKDIIKRIQNGFRKRKGKKCKKRSTESSLTSGNFNETFHSDANDSEDEHSKQISFNSKVDKISRITITSSMVKEINTPEDSNAYVLSNSKSQGTYSIESSISENASRMQELMNFRNCSSKSMDREKSLLTSFITPMSYNSFDIKSETASEVYESSSSWMDKSDKETSNSNKMLNASSASGRNEDVELPRYDLIGITSKSKLNLVTKSETPFLISEISNDCFTPASKIIPSGVVINVNKSIDGYSHSSNVSNSKIDKADKSSDINTLSLSEKLSRISQALNSKVLILDSRQKSDRTTPSEWLSDPNDIQQCFNIMSKEEIQLIRSTMSESLSSSDSQILPICIIVNSKSDSTNAECKSKSDSQLKSKSSSKIKKHIKLSNFIKKKVFKSKRKKSYLSVKMSNQYEKERGKKGIKRKENVNNNTESDDDSDSESTTMTPTEHTYNYCSSTSSSSSYSESQITVTPSNQKSSNKEKAEKTETTKKEKKDNVPKVSPKSTGLKNKEVPKVAVGKLENKKPSLTTTSVSSSSSSDSGSSTSSISKNKKIEQKLEELPKALKEEKKEKSPVHSKTDNFTNSKSTLKMKSISNSANEKPASITNDHNTKDSNSISSKKSKISELKEREAVKSDEAKLQTVNVILTLPTVTTSNSEQVISSHVKSELTSKSKSHLNTAVQPPEAKNIETSNTTTTNSSTVSESSSSTESSSDTTTKASGSSESETSSKSEAKGAKIVDHITIVSHEPQKKENNLTKEPTPQNHLKISRLHKVAEQKESTPISNLPASQKFTENKISLGGIAGNSKAQVKPPVARATFLLNKPSAPKCPRKFTRLASAGEQTRRSKLDHLLQSTLADQAHNRITMKSEEWSKELLYRYHLPVSFFFGVEDE